MDTREGSSPATSAAILQGVLSTLRTRGAFGGDGPLDPCLERWVQSLVSLLPTRLFPDVYLEQPLVGGSACQVGFVLDNRERNYLCHMGGDSYFARQGIRPELGPEHAGLLCGMVERGGGPCPHYATEGDLVALDDVWDAPVDHLLAVLRHLPVRMSMTQDEDEVQLLLSLPRLGSRERLLNASWWKDLVEALKAMGVVSSRMASLPAACVRCGIPCDVAGAERHRWIAYVDVSHLRISFAGGKVKSCAVGLRISDRTVPFAGTTLRFVQTYQWHITERCDQRCRHCYLYGEDAQATCATMPMEQMLRVLDELERICARTFTTLSLAITGGDPLLHPQFWELAEELHRRGVVWNAMGNPFHLTDDTCRRLRSLGCMRYQLSLDGLRPYHDWLRMPGSYDATIEAGRRLKAHGLAVQLMATACRRNLNDILACMDVAHEMGADCFTFARYCATSPQKAQELYPTADEYRAFLLAFLNKREAFAQKGSRCAFRLKEHLFVPLLHELGEFEVPQWSREHPQRICGGCHLAKKPAIAANGDLLACPRTGIVVGNLAYDHIADVQNNQAMCDLRDVHAIEGCRDCDLLMWCRGCRAVGYAATGDPHAADPLCWYRTRG